MIVNFLVFLCLFFSSAVFAQSDLIGGKPAEKGDFTEVVYIQTQNGNTISRCTATAVGPRVILTAAHCVKDGGEIKPTPAGRTEKPQSEFVVNQIVFKAKCKQAPEYRDNKEDLDVALCVTDKVIDVEYATISKIAPKVGEFATLLGYGCTKTPGHGGNDGILRWGEAKITSLPRSGYNWFDTVGNTTLCFGDSGGPAMRRIKEPLAEDHVVIGVNSRGDIVSRGMFTALYLEKSQKFIKDFIEVEKVKICGINLECNYADGPGDCN